MPAHESKTKFLDAALKVIRTKGYDATTVDDICAAARLTKGSFFHHFKSKEELGVAAAAHWGETTADLFASAPYHALADPRDRLFGYVDFRKAMVRGELPEFTCFLGTMVQDAYATHPALREACDAGISEHAATLTGDIAAAKARYAPTAAWSAESLALYTQAVIQGAFILAKARNGPAIARDSLDHLRRYLELLFTQPQRSRKGKSR
ncbi:MAG TPA: TetR/AcrR family transcriptional regulator [Vicinamibacterales bacterium]|jgi:TetR/AcrR family transcriptional repressor of nem operon|nr:TetR/AcrR family transcriptional regulator [Vicinamibacterales bacterium]